MDIQLRDKFTAKWKKYFGKAELPIAFYYTSETEAEYFPQSKGWSCLIGDLKQVRNGKSYCFDVENTGCGGGRRYTGFADMTMPDFNHFLSCGIPGKLEGERYIKSPEMVDELMKNMQKVPSEGKKLIFKRWDKLEETDNPEVVIFFATPDILSGLFTLANFDQTEPNTNMAPFGAGCASIIHYPWLETKNDRQHAIIGMFDVSARPYVKENELSFAVPFEKFKSMINNMDESFLITGSWEKVSKRINR